MKFHLEESPISWIKKIFEYIPEKSVIGIALYPVVDIHPISCKLVEPVIIAVSLFEEVGEIAFGDEIPVISSQL